MTSWTVNFSKNRYSYSCHDSQKVPLWYKKLSNLPLCPGAHSRFRHYFSSNLYKRAPRGPRGVKRCPRIHLTCHLRFGALILSLDWQNFEKPSKLKKSHLKMFVFRIFFNLGSILAHQTSNGMLSGSWGIFWHPWDPWGWIHIEDIKVLEFVFIFFWVVAHKGLKSPKRFTKIPEITT